MNEISNKLQECYDQLTIEGSAWEIQKSKINGIDYKIFKNAPSNLIEIIKMGREYNEKEFIIFENERMTFKNFFMKVDALAYSFIHILGASLGDHIAIAMRNYPEWMIVFCAIIYSGCVVVPLNSWGKLKELKYSLDDSKSSIVVLDQERYSILEDNIKTLNIKIVTVRESCDNNFAIPLQDLIKQSGINKLKLPNICNESPAIIMYTSGTTGNPKGAISNHRAIGQAIYNFECAANVAAMNDQQPVIKMLERGFDPKVLLTLPLFHVSGCHSVFLLSLRAGRSIVMMKKWDKIDALNIIEKEHITIMSAVPSMLMEMLETKEWNNFDTSSLFAFGAGGSSQPPKLKDLIYKKLPDSFPGTGYGMTETNACGFSMTGEPYRQNAKSVGIISPIIEAKIINKDGFEIQNKKQGEIYIKSITNITGYWNNSQANKETFINGYLATGDVGYIENGFLFITDRIKDVIIKGGENIYSTEIENTILKNENIEEAAAFGIPHNILGEELALAIVLKPNKIINEQDVKKYIASKLAKFKIPSFVFFESKLPKNATHKILKNEIRKKYNNI